MCTQHVERIEAEPLHECYSLQQRSVEIDFIDGCAQQKSFRIRRSERESLSTRRQGIGDNGSRFSMLRLCAQGIRITSSKALRENSSTHAGRSAGPPVAVRRAVRIDNTGGIPNQIGRNSLDHQSSAKY